MIARGEREPLPGEVCECGRPAVLVFVTERHGDVAWCGVSDGAGQALAPLGRAS